MAYTISTHNGSAVSRQHNLRNPKVVSKQQHIRIDGVHETWIDVNPRDAYREIFGPALEEYNQRQRDAGRPERCIKSYYTAVKNDAKKHVAYEMIVAIGSKTNPPPSFAAKQILRDFVNNWPQRNPSLHLIGAYYHRDEQGVGHVHVDYIPVATGYKNGLAVQTGLVKALGAQGFRTRSTRDTAQIQWERRENEYLEQLCRDRGLEIEHPREEGRKHLHTEQYKAKAELEQVKAERDYIAGEAKKMREKGDKRFAEYKSVLDHQKARIEVNNATIEAQEREIRLQERIYEAFGGDPIDLRTLDLTPEVSLEDDEIAEELDE